MAEIATQNSTETKKEFIPKPKMVDLLRVMADPTQKPTITAWCEAIDIDRGTYYDWQDDPDFVEWFAGEWEKIMQKMMPYLDNIALKKAATDFRYMEMLKMQYGKFSRKSDITSGGEKLNTTITFVNGAESP